MKTKIAIADNTADVTVLQVFPPIDADFLRGFREEFQRGQTDPFFAQVNQIIIPFRLQASRFRARLNFKLVNRSCHKIAFFIDEHRGMIGDFFRFPSVFLRLVVGKRKAQLHGDKFLRAARIRLAVSCASIFPARKHAFPVYKQFENQPCLRAEIPLRVHTEMPYEYGDRIFTLSQIRGNIQFVDRFIPLKIPVLIARNELTVDKKRIIPVARKQNFALAPFPRKFVVKFSVAIRQGLPCHPYPFCPFKIAHTPASFLFFFHYTNFFTVVNTFPKKNAPFGCVFLSKD